MISATTIKEFPWGKVITVHSIGDIDIIEAFDRKRDGCRILAETDFDKTTFSAYLNGKSIHQAFETLDQAIIGALCYKHDGYNSHAAYYIFSMLGMKEATK